MVTVNGGYNSYDSRQWETSRPVTDHVQSEESPEETYAPPSTVAKALREQCRIPFETFFLVTYKGKGEFSYFSGPNRISEEEIRKIFRREKFLQWHNSASQGNLPRAYDHHDEYQESSLQFEDQWAPLPKRRKRPRASEAPRRDRDRDCDDEDRPVIESSKRALVIGDSEAVRDFYTQRFRCLQQTACKIIAKPIIRVISPKKQASNPYTKRDAAAPAWWPKPWGKGEKDKVRHVEPDHQWKTERVYLLTHIIKMLVDPNKQPLEMQRLGITIARIETVAMDSLRSFFSDTGKPKNAKKKAILKEIFKVAKMEEKYMRDEIDGGTQVLVTEDDLVMDHCFDSEDEGSDEENMADVKGEPGEYEVPSTVSPTQAAASALPNGLVPALPPTTGNMLALQQPQSTSFFHTLPIRNQYAPTAAMLPSALGPDPYYSEPSGLSSLPSLHMHELLSTGPQHQPQHHDAARRSSLFAASPATDFSSAGGASPTALYSVGAPQHHHQHPHSPWDTTQSPQSQHPGTSSSAATTPATTPETTSALYVYPGTAAAAAAAAQHHHRQYEHPQQQHHHHQAQQHHQQQQQQHHYQQVVTVPQLPPPMPQQPTQGTAPTQYTSSASVMYTEQQHHQQQAALFRGGNIHLAMHPQEQQQQQQQQHQQQQHQGYPPAGRSSL